MRRPAGLRLRIPFAPGAHATHRVRPAGPPAQVKSAGLLKMRLRVIDKEVFEDFIRENPPDSLRSMYKERPCKIRLYVYSAARLSPRHNGQYPTPFLKVYNVDGRERTTRHIPIPPSLDPEFYQSFELSALLPGQSRLHVEVWDFQLLSETLVGTTIIDLEDRYFSQQWKEMQLTGELPREVRPLVNPANANAQGFIMVKVEILEKRYAIANPIVPIEPPHTDMYELRIIVWDAVDVKARDEAFFGGGGTSDVFISLQPFGSQPYPKYQTDVHWRSPGDAEFNFRMVWPMALPEKSPRLFMQVWDADILSANDAIGETILTLKPICEQAIRRGGIVRRENVLIDTFHPNYVGNQGTVRLTIELMPRFEALQKPVGQGRGKPNQFPFLAEPVRPSLFDGLGFDFNFLNPFYFLKKYFACCCCCCVVVAVVGVLMMGSSPGGRRLGSLNTEEY